MEVLPAWLETNYAIGTLYRPMSYSKLPISLSSSHRALAPLSSLTTLVKFSPSDAPTDEGPTACVKQVANFPLPSLLPNQNETLHTARAAAVEGYLSAFTIPLLAEPETLIQTARLNWVLRFPLPPPNSAPTDVSPLLRPYHYGPRTPQALDAAIRHAANFTYDDPPPTHPHTSAFMQLPDPATRFGDIRRPTTEPPSPPPPDVQRWLQSGAIRLHSQAEYQLFGANIAHLPPLLENHFFGHISLDQLITLLSSHPSDPQALHAAVQQFRASKKARLVIVAGPASLASSHFFLSITPPFSISTWPGLSLSQVSPSNLLPPPSSSYLLPHHPHHSGPACHCGRSRQDPFSLSLHLHPSGFPSLTFVICLARLIIVASPASSILTTYPSPPPPTPFCPSLLEARLVIVAGPAWSSPSTSRPCLFSLLLSPLPLLSLFSCRPARAGRHGRSKVILLPLCH